MDKANTIPELVKNLYTDPIKEDKEFYIGEIYETQIAKLRDSIYYDDNYSEFYLAGQSGTGKTTALNFLADKNINKKYTVTHLYFRDLVDLNDIDFIDIVLVFCYEITKLNKKLEAKFIEELEKIYNIHTERLESYKEIEKSSSVGLNIQAQAKIGFDFWSLLKAGVSFVSDFKINRHARNVTREFFKYNDMDIINLANKMIRYFNEINEGNKELLVIFDDLDKIRKNEYLEKVFLRNNNNFSSILCKKVIAIPVTEKPEFKGDDDNIPIVLNIKTEHNPLSANKPTEIQNAIIKRNKYLLKEIFWQRCENKNLIEPEAIEKAIEFSGGILRQYIQILRDAGKQARRLKADKITLQDVEDTVADLRNYWSRAVIGEKIAVYEKIRSTKKSVNVDVETLTNAILANHIIAHSNNDIWYDVNPLIQETLKNYTSDIKLDE